MYVDVTIPVSTTPPDFSPKVDIKNALSSSYKCGISHSCVLAKGQCGCSTREHGTNKICFLLLQQTIHSHTFPGSEEAVSNFKRTHLFLVLTDWALEAFFSIFSLFFRVFSSSKPP